MLKDKFKETLDSVMLVLKNFADRVRAFFEKIKAKISAEEKKEEENELEQEQEQKEETGEVHSETVDEEKLLSQMPSEMQQDFREFLQYRKESQPRKKILSFVLDFFDFAIDVAFFICLIFVVKPVLLGEYELLNESGWINVFFAKITEIFIGFPQDGVIDDATLYLRNFVFVLSLLCYIEGKIVIAIFAKKSTCGISCILAVAVAACTLLIRANFILFLVFFAILYFAYEFSCGFSIKQMVKKLVFLLVLIPVLYVILNLIFMPEIHELFKKIFQCLFLPVKITN